jgi:TonB family protein
MLDKLIALRYLILLILGLNPILAFCQDSKSQTETSRVLSTEIQSKLDSSFIVIDDTELFVSFPGGEKALKKFISKNLIYPEPAIKERIEGQVLASFTIDKNGKISNIVIVKESNPYFDSEVVRLISIMPDWIWDKRIQMKDRKLTKRTLPISFRLNKRQK